jgi:UDP-N-acetylmuramyl pentapeptide phosphotransferase/UDP-N-acetylglucosamine-1-phosphate transferase
LSFAFGSSILAFLGFNWEPSKIFMGDTGTLTIGFSIGFLAIHFINQNFVTSENEFYHFRSSIGTTVCVLIIPIFDTVRVIILRIRKLQSPLKADQNHLHHQFIKIGFTHAQTALSIGGVNVLFIVLSLILRNHSDIVILSVVVFLCLTINQLLKAAQKGVMNRREN